MLSVSIFVTYKFSTITHWKIAQPEGGIWG